MSELRERRLRVATEVSRLEAARSIAEIAAFAIAALWGIYVFVYQEVLKPAAETPRMTAAATLNHSRLKNGDEFLAVTIAYENTGKVDIEFAAESLNVWTRRVVQSRAHPATAGPAWEDDRSRALSTPRLAYAAGNVFDPAVNGQRGFHFFLAPGAKTSQTFTLVIAGHDDDVVEVGYETWFLRTPVAGERVPLERRARPDGSSTVVATRPVRGAYDNTGAAAFPL